MAAPGLFLQCAGRRLELSAPVVMGVLNVTPDSFSDGGRHADPSAALRRAEQMLEQGAAIIDIGGESTRPGAAPVPLDEELSRVLPVVTRLSRWPVVVSVDTSKPEVMRAALEAGAGLVNDVRALREPGALQVVAATGAGVCLMHMQGEPRTMQSSPAYGDVVGEVAEFLGARVMACEAAGIARARIAIDPGFGFGKTVAHNLRLLRHLRELAPAGCAVLAGLSRKSLLGALTGRPVEARLAGGIAAAVMAVVHGAHIIRSHDVAETVDALRVAAAVAGGSIDG